MYIKYVDMVAYHPMSLSMHKWGRDYIIRFITIYSHFPKHTLKYVDMVARHPMSLNVHKCGRDYLM